MHCMSLLESAKQSLMWKVNTCLFHKLSRKDYNTNQLSAKKLSGGICTRKVKSFDFPPSETSLTIRRYNKQYFDIRGSLQELKPGHQQFTNDTSIKHSSDFYGECFNTVTDWLLILAWDCLNIIKYQKFLTKSRKYLEDGGKAQIQGNTRRCWSKVVSKD